MIYTRSDSLLPNERVEYTINSFTEDEDIDKSLKFGQCEFELLEYSSWNSREIV